MDNHQPANSHFIIGLTGNIGTGKSTVRKMLEYLGALGIDADRVAQNALMKDSPAYPEIISLFGDTVVDISGEIDRKKLGSIVFNDVKKLKQLETIIHPLVSKACNNIISHSPLPIVVIEAIKLLESDLADLCQSIWVVDSKPEVVYRRLKKNRGMSRDEVNTRLSKQSPTLEKIRQADVVIHNNKSSQDTWRQVQFALTAVIESRQFLTTSQNQTFLPEILPPSEDSSNKLRSLLSQNPDSLLNRVLAARMTGQNEHSRIKNWHTDTELVFQSLYRFHYSQTENTQLACWDLDHFTCTFSGTIQSAKDEDHRELLTLLDRMEYFGKIRLCHRFSIPINKKEVSFIEEKGYEKQQKSSSLDKVYQKAGYNLYTKMNLLSFKFF